jgi:hypothetical protein
VAQNAALSLHPPEKVKATTVKANQPMTFAFAD